MDVASPPSDLTSSERLSAGLAASAGKLQTNWIFDGHWGTDVAGRTRWFRDFNSDNGGYKDADGQTGTDIALIKLDARKKGLTPIEDDNEKGVHHNGATFDPCVNEYRLQPVRADRWDLGTEPWETLKFHINPSGRKDDVYTYSGAFGFTESNTSFFPPTWDADNADLGPRLVKETVN